MLNAAQFAKNGINLGRMKDAKTIDYLLMDFVDYFVRNLSSV